VCKVWAAACWRGLSYALIRIVFAPPLWSRAVALVSGMWGVATLFGPAVGGLFAESGNWRMAFWVLLPVSAAQALIVLLQLRGVAKSGTGQVRVPVLKIILLALSVLSVALAGQFEQTGAKLAGVACGLAFGMLVARLDQRPGVQLLPTGAYRLDSVMGKVFACVCLLMIGTTTEIFVPYFLQTIHGYTPLLGRLHDRRHGRWLEHCLTAQFRPCRWRS